MAVSVSVRRLVKERAALRREYCRMAEAWEPFFIYHVEHITARQHGGADEPDNLAFACHHCNLLRGPNLASLDPDTGNLARLFDPRSQNWNDHFTFDAGLIVGRTAAGRTTVVPLNPLPQQRHSIRRELGIAGDDRQPFGLCLANHEAVKRIAMMPRQRDEAAIVLKPRG